ncbi:MAG: sulfur carrier protein ThiS [Pontibacterium sp.]
MQVNVNGDALELQQGATLADLIATLELTGKRIAIEVNMDIVPRSEHPSFALSEGDVVEVVHAIGGG